MGAVEIRQELGITNGVVQGTLGRMLRQGRVARRENPHFDRWTKQQLKPKPECRWLWYATGIEWKPSELWTRVRMNAHAYPEASNLRAPCAVRESTTEQGAAGHDFAVDVDRLADV